MNILTPHQKQFLDFLRRCTFLRWEQAAIWFDYMGYSRLQTEQQLNRLLRYRKMSLNDEQILCPFLLTPHQPEESRLLAIDIMLKIGKQRVCEISFDMHPYQLVFTVEKEMNIADFGVLFVTAGGEKSSVQKLRTATRAVGTVIFCLEQESQIERIEFNHPCLFAVFDSGKVKFYQNEKI
jgi:hypothetical protein